MSGITQAVTLIAALAALGISAWQGRATGRQVREASKQSQAATSSLHHGSFQELVRHGADFLFEYMREDPELTDWFLRSRGLQGADELENRKNLFLWIRIDVHQANMVAYTNGRLPEDLWLAWMKTVRRDIAMAEFRPLWKAAKVLYTPKFVDLIDTELAKTPNPRNG